MLHIETPFPAPGSIGYRAHTCEPVRIIRANADATLLVTRLRRLPCGAFAGVEGASANQTLPRAELFADTFLALHNGKVPGRVSPARNGALARRAAPQGRQSVSAPAARRRAEGKQGGCPAPAA